MSLEDTVSDYGNAVKAKISNPAAIGAPEDQLRAPLETLIEKLAELIGLPRGQVVLVGESSLSTLKTRPDYALTVRNALVGFVEVKAPGKGADPRRFQDRHDKEQWEKLRSLPNLIYTDGNAFSLWRNGALEGAIVHLEGGIETAGRKLKAPSSLLALFGDFLQWKPTPPRTARQLADVCARLCRLLRDEVAEQLTLGTPALTNLAAGWRKLLFPNATNEAFADGYAQAVTFGLLMARARGISLDGGLDRAAQELRRSNSLIGAALRLLTDDADNQATLQTSLMTLTRVLEAVDWPTISKGEPEAWLYFYENFLGVYDNTLRKKTGSYYTPPEVVQTMVRLVDEALRAPGRFALPQGLASSEVTVADPATGTGTFLLGLLRRIAEGAEADQGEGAVAGAVRAAMSRLIGFEIQFGPFAVAQLRLLAEIAELTGGAETVPAAPLRLYVTDTLGNPFVEEEGWIAGFLEPLGTSRREANRIKREESITVVIGNPPYKEKAKGLGGWIEAGSPNAKAPAPLSDWMPPKAWKVGTHAKHLRNLYVYFWRWAAWKVFGDGAGQERKGIVCFITVAGFLNGPGFQKMRADLRRDADEVWVIDCSPEGHQPPVPTRIFEGVQQPVCIVMVLRRSDAGTDGPARVRYRALPAGPRGEKFKALAAITLDGGGWSACPDEERASFFPAKTGAWSDFAALEDLFTYNGSGVMPGRTWVIAPDPASLEARWNRLRAERDPSVKETLFHPHLRGGKPGDKHLNKMPKQGLYGHEFRSSAVANDEGAVVRPMRYGFRSFDKQWIIPDARVLNQPNPGLWENHSNAQVYLTALQQHAPTMGPAVTFTGFIPDLHHYKGSFGGRAFPLWADRGAAAPNVRPALLDALSKVYGKAARAEDVMAYVAGIAAHPAYVETFAADLVQPGLRLPVTADAGLFEEVAAVGREVIWLHCFGERFCDPAAGRPAGPPRLSAGTGPAVPRDGAIPSAPDRMPNTIDHDPARHRLIVGEGYVENVSKAVWEYEVSGKQVLAQWFSYRRRDRSRPIIGDRRPPSPLDRIQPEGWLADYTTELLNVLHVLGRLVALEPRQAELLKRVCEGRLLTASVLRSKGAFDSSTSGRKKASDQRQFGLV
ncbi:MAG: N-6 DNA methylase [Geminicoccaceae bacterium]|nr:N-6 DNA methylase [Geminicoccaceae bacterium]